MEKRGGEGPPDWEGGGGGERRGVESGEVKGWGGDCWGVWG